MEYTASYGDPQSNEIQTCHIINKVRWLQVNCLVLQILPMYGVAILCVAVAD